MFSLLKHTIIVLFIGRWRIYLLRHYQYLVVIFRHQTCVWKEMCIFQLLSIQFYISPLDQTCWLDCLNLQYSYYFVNFCLFDLVPPVIQSRDSFIEQYSQMVCLNITHNALKMQVPITAHILTQYFWVMDKSNGSTNTKMQK